MKPLAVWLATVGCLAFAADRKPLPNQAGNDDLDIFATVLLDRQEIQQAVGAAMNEGYAVVRVRVVPKADQALRVSLDDFTLISRKDGERSPALDPEQITGQVGLIVKSAASQPSRMSTVSNGPIWGGVKPAKAPAGDGAGDSVKIPESHADGVPPEENPTLVALKAKSLPEQESKKPVEGLLYFAVDGKLKPKDLGLVYKSPNGRLVVDFK